MSVRERGSVFVEEGLGVKGKGVFVITHFLLAVVISVVDNSKTSVIYINVVVVYINSMCFFCLHLFIIIIYLCC